MKKYPLKKTEKVRRDIKFIRRLGSAMFLAVIPCITPRGGQSTTVRGW